MPRGDSSASSGTGLLARRRLDPVEGLIRGNRKLGRCISSSRDHLYHHVRPSRGSLRLKVSNGRRLPTANALCWGQPRRLRSQPATPRSVNYQSRCSSSRRRSWSRHDRFAADAVCLSPEGWIRLPSCFVQPRHRASQPDAMLGRTFRVAPWGRYLEPRYQPAHARGWAVKSGVGD